MYDPFKITGPTMVGLSGGRTSAYMLWRVLQSNGGLPDECVVSFQNTGKEHEKTLDFVRDIGKNWDVPIVWLEYDPQKELKYKHVDWETASRNGEPFAALIENKKYLPNPIARFCTAELKVRTSNRYIKAEIGWEEWDQMVGIRADEERRASKIRARPSPDIKASSLTIPLADAGVTVHDVGAFWESQPFDLGIPTHNGKAMLGNCDLCFLKGAKQLRSIISSEPDRADWWAEQEAKVAGLTTGDGGYFRKDRPCYATMKKQCNEQQDLFGVDEDMLGCFCGD